MSYSVSHFCNFIKKCPFYKEYIICYKETMPIKLFIYNYQNALNINVNNKAYLY